jgi:hypothetical protein
MGRAPALNTIKRQFDRRIQSSVSLYSRVTVFAFDEAWDAIQGWEPLTPAQARRIVSLAFLDVVSHWEDFLERCFVRYLAGAVSPTGYKPVLRLRECKSIQHAYELLSLQSEFDTRKAFLSWNSWKDVIQKAKIFFVRGEPFANLSNVQAQRLQDATKIRNRIAHYSKKCREEFIEVAKQHLGLQRSDKLQQGFDVGQLLLTKGTRGFACKRMQHYFLHYMDLFLEVSNVIAP